MESSETVEEWIRAEAAKLDTFYNQIVGCRVSVEVPHRHHKKGTRYHIRIGLTLPGGELVIKREPNLSSRARQVGETEVTKNLELKTPHKNLRLAINDAFKAAGRRLQDYARRQSGHTKTHEPPLVARVRKLFSDKGYGFLVTPDGREIYFHKNSVLKRAFRRLRVGTRVAFAEEQGETGPQASTVRIVGKRTIRGADEAPAVSPAV